MGFVGGSRHVEVGSVAVERDRKADWCGGTEGYKRVSEWVCVGVCVGDVLLIFVFIHIIED